jgi:phosphoglycolate phosphatase-like HAD superfamily hydrolase
MTPRGIRAILWDFGDTLCDQTWALAPLEGERAWATLYRQVLDSDGLVDRWDRGEATTVEVSAAVARRLGAAPGKVQAHMEACCRNITFFPRVMDLVAHTRLPQAIVTINPDIFSEVVVPAYRLRERFETIVTSWQERTVDKARLCEIAMARIGPDLRPENCLLVDNLSENTEAWRARGGAALHFTGEAALLESWPL